jgi:GT2 family glycosyltransferase
VKVNETVIILVNYNGLNDTRECIGSLRQLSPQPFVVVVDNDSDDAHDLEKLRAEYSQLHIIYNTENIGFGRANNVGICWVQENMQFDYLCLLNNDTLVTKDFLEHLKKPFAIDPKIGITTGKIFYESERELIWYGGGEINYTRGWPRIVNYKKKPSNEGANKSKYVSFVSGCLMLFTKDSIAALKGFDEDIFMYCEDLDLCIRAKKEHIKLYYSSEAIIYHKVQGNKGINQKGLRPQNPNLKFLFLNMKKNQYMVFNKHLKGGDLYLFRFVFIVELIILSLRLFIKGQFLVFQWSLQVLNLKFKR